MINYNYCKDSYYDVVDDIYQKLRNIVNKIELDKEEVFYGYIGLPENVIVSENDNSLNEKYLPGVKTIEFKNFLEDEIQMSNYFRKYVVTIIDEDGQIINVDRDKITKQSLPEGQVEFRYDGIVIQNIKNQMYLLHGGLRNAVMIELEKAYRSKGKKYKGKLEEGREAFIEFASEGFVTIWPLYPQDYLDCYGKRKSESTIFFNKPFKPTENQLKKSRILFSTLVYNRDVKEILTSRMNSRGVQCEFGYYKGGNEKELLQSLDAELQSVSGR